MAHEHEVIRIHHHHMDHAMHNTYLVVNQLIVFALGIVELILGLRFIFRLFDANAGTAFVSFVYSLADGLLFPFRFIFPNTSAQTGGIVEWSTLVGMAVYALIAWLIMRLINIPHTAADKEVIDREVEEDL